MKKLRTLCTLFALCISTLTFSQNDDFFIEGPGWLCAGECGTYYFFELPGGTQQAVFEIQLFDGSVYTTQEPYFDYCFDAPGTYEMTVFAYVQDTTFEASFIIFVEPFEEIPYEAFGELCPSNGMPFGCEKVCEGATVTYNFYSLDSLFDLSQVEFISTNGVESYTINGNTMTVTWGGAPTGSIYMEDYNTFPNSVCGSYIDICTEIIPYPEASFTTTPEAQNEVLNICSGQTVQFQNTTTGAASYEWNFGNGTSEETNPENTYLTPGEYEVTLVAFNECGCPDTTSLTVMVEALESPAIDCISTVCEGETVTYTSDANCGTFDWVISGNGQVLDGGTTSDNFVTIQWGAGPVGTIELTVDDCPNASFCLAPTYMEVPIVSDLAQIEGPEEVCRGAVADYTLPAYEGTEYSWTSSNFGNIISGQGTNEITVEWANFWTSSQQWIAVDFTNCYLGCGGSDTIFVNVLPEIYIEGPIEVCANADASYQTIETRFNMPIDANWSVVDGNNTTVWTSTGASNNPLINWNFGPGAYTLRAEADDPTSFCVDEFEITVTVLAPPAPVDNISGETTICAGETYSYQVETSLMGTSFVWTVNNGGAIDEVYGKIINVTWANTGPYELSVVQVSQTGCQSDPITQSINALGSFSITGDMDICQDQTAIYSADVFEGITYDWVILPDGIGTITGDPDSSTVEILWHEAGPATIELNLCGQTESIVVEVRPRPKPVVDFPVELCANETATVMTTSTFDSYTWKDEFGGVVSTATNPQLGPGYYQVVVENQYGCIGDTTFHIDDLPIPDISISTPNSTGFCAGDPPVTLYALNSDGGYTYQWYQDGNPVGTDAPTYTTTDYGFYYVEVVAQNGCVNQSNTIELFEFCGFGGGICTGGTCTIVTDCEPGTLVSFSMQNTSECNTTQFINTSTGLQPGYAWNFDDPGSGADNVSTDMHPTHTYSKAGFFVVVLLGEVTDPMDPTQTILCWDAQVDTVEVAANFDVDNACAGSPARFTDLSTFLPFVSIDSWEWDFGDPASGADNTSTDPNPDHLFATEGTYTVTLTVTSSTGCTASISKEVEVYPTPPVTFDEPLIVCEGTALNFIAQVSPTVTYAEWDFGDPSSGTANTSELFDTYHAYDTPGNYTVTLFVQSIYGCSNTFTRTITIEPNGLIGDITMAPASPICEGDQTTITSSPGGITWLWSTEETTESIITGETGVYEVTVTDADGCIYKPEPAILDIIPAPESPVRVVEYNDFFQPIAYFYDGYEACYGEDIFLETIESANYSFTWSNGDDGPETEYSEARGNLLPPGEHDIFLTVLDNSSGCSNEIGPFVITIHDLPSNVGISASQNGLICEGTETTFTVNSPDANLTYLWTTGETGTSITTGAAGEYYVTAVNEFGCEAESNTLAIAEGPDISLVPSGCHERCNPDTLCLPPIPGVVSYQWYQDGMPVTDPSGTIPELVVTESGEYYLEMVDNQGCMLTSGSLNLNLYDGYGDILGNVYMDVNENGIIDGPDTLVSGVDIQLLEGGTLQQTQTSDVDGAYLFDNILSTDYTLEVDPGTLPDNTVVVDPIDPDVSLVGCDVSETVDWLLVLDCPESGSDLDLVGCDGASVTYNGQTYSSNTSFTEIYQTDSGCDSTENVSITIIPAMASDLSLETCDGQAVVYEGEMLLPGDEQDFIFQTSSGCDSTVTVTVIGYTSDSEDKSFDVCPGQTITYEGTILEAGDTEVFILENQDGCDSTVTVSVTELPTDVESLSYDVCPGQTITYDGVILNAGVEQDFVFTNQYGCDSTVTVSVIESPSETESLSFDACAGSTITYNGMELAPGANETFVFANQYGCDSTVLVSVNELPTSSETLGFTVCPGETVTYDGMQLAAGANETFTFMNEYGCDSTVMVNVVESAIVEEDLLFQVCPGETINYNGTEYAAGANEVFNFTNQHGCDSIVSIAVSSYPEMDYLVESDPSCANSPNGEIRIQTTGSYEYSLNGVTFQTANSFQNLFPQTYELWVKDGNDCETSEIVNVTALPELSVIVEDAVMSCDDLEADLEVFVLSGDFAAISYEWEDGFVGSQRTITEPGSYQVVVENVCESITLEAVVDYGDPGLADYFYVPNAFSPNGDGINDDFTAMPALDVQVDNFEFQVFDRWGNLISISDDPYKGWDGKLNNKLLQTGVYVWRMIADVQVCGREVNVVKKGDVVLMR